jgi:hypothetical protein
MRVNSAGLWFLFCPNLRYTHLQWQEGNKMSNQMTREEIYQIAKKRVEEKKSLLIHALVYLVVNALLVTIWAVSGSGYLWFLWPLGGWGVGLIFHFLGVFVFDREMGWEKKAIEKEAEKIWDKIEVDKEIEKARQNNNQSTE